MDLQSSASNNTASALVPAPMPMPMASIMATASPITVPMAADLSDGAAASPAITNVTGSLPPPTVSPMAPSLSMSNPTGHGALSAAAGVHKIKGTTKTQAGMNGGRWTEQEHQSFLAGLRLYGREWKKVASKIKTRTSAQIRSHAQKYFAKLARDDETRKQGGVVHHLQSPDGSITASYGYMSDDGSSTAENNSGDDGGDTDSSQRSVQPLRSSLAVHPYPSMGSTQAGSMSALFKSAPTTLPTKKRSRSVSSTESSPSSKDKMQEPFKQRKTLREPLNRLPSPEELVEKVSPTVRQRLASLIEAEISALQVLSCYAWLQQQDPAQLKVAKQHPHHNLGVMGVGSPSTTPFPGSSSMSLTMITTEHSPSIY